MSEHKQDRIRPLAALFWDMVKLIVIVILGWLFAILISCGWSLLTSPEVVLPALTHNLMIHDHFARELSVSVNKINLVNWYMNLQTMIDHTIQYFQTSGFSMLSTANKNLPELVRGLLNTTRLSISSMPYLTIVLLATKLMLYKLVELIFMLPLFLLFSLIGLVDGLVKRDLRRFSGGRESTLLYHANKQLLTTVVALFLVGYLAVPFILAPDVIVVIFAFFLAWMMANSFKQLKKYI